MSSELRDYLGRLFSTHGGSISFERFMGEALYHPKFGYYTANIDTVGGERGDFSTSATVSASFGQALARWLQALEVPSTFDLVEVGGGSGAWLAGILSEMSWRARRRARCQVVEISPVLQAVQRETLGWWRSRSIRWCHEIQAALQSPTVPAVVFSNELVDAFPVILLQWNAARGGWDEVYLAYDAATGLREVFVPLKESRPEVRASRFSVLRGSEDQPPPDGQRVELHASYHSWLEEVANRLPRGSHLLTIDYGHEDHRQIYDKRLRGSLRAYQRRNRLTGSGVYRLFGRQDLTADVNFTDLREWGEGFGMETVRLESQSAFLNRYLEPGSENRETQYLLSEDGAGSAFRVLHQRKI